MMSGPIKLPHIFIDMDDVLFDFVGEALRLHGRPEVLDNYPPKEWRLSAVLGISDADFWGKIDDAGPGWWANLPLLPRAMELVELCRTYAPITIATSPSRHWHSAAGKIQALQKHFGPDFRDYMIGPQKHLLARRGCLLIDDADRNVLAFDEAGGATCLVPRPWNRGHFIKAGSDIPFVESRILQTFFYTIEQIHLPLSERDLPHERTLEARRPVEESPASLASSRRQADL